MTMMAAEANTASIPSTKLFADEVIGRKVPINSFQTPSINKLNGHKMATTNSKINVDGSVVDDDDDPFLDG